jgi:uncharacterized protein YndB with AHSA1/START domain
MHFANSITIRRPPAEVFAYLATFENIPRWNYAIAATRRTSAGPIGVGATYRQHRTVPRPADESFEVVEFEPNRRLAIQGDLGPLHGTLRYELEAVPEGTRLTNEADLSGSGLAAIVAPLAASQIREAVGANLGELRAILEAA